MVNAPQMHKDRRAREVNAIQNSIRQEIVQGKMIDFNKVVMATMANLNISKRTAREYVEIAFYNEGIDTKPNRVRQVQETDGKTNEGRLD